MKYDFDLVVLGGGPAGEKGAAQAAYFGKRVAIVERAPEPGGAAVHTGTLPSKTLRETSLFLSGYRQRELYGLTVTLKEDLAVPKLLSRKDTVRELEVERIQANLARHKVELIHGQARVVDAHTVEASGRTITSEIILVATGSAPFQPPNIPFGKQVADSDTILELDVLPKRMVVIGGGVIGSEYATMFAAMHVKVTLLEGRDRLLPFLDAEMGDRLQGAMKSLGVDIKLGASVEKVTLDDDVNVFLKNGEMIECDKLLVASGRSGNTKGLGLDALGVGVDKRGYVQVDENFKTKVDSIYAAGDVIGFPALASTSMDQARVAVCHAFGFTYKKQVSHLLPYGVYTIPEVSCVGFSEEQAREQKLEYVVGRALYVDNARGKIVGDKEGAIKLLFDRGSRKLLGAHCIGDKASELVHIGQAVIALGGTVDTLIDMVFNYPTLAEMFKYAAYDALGHWAKD
ncbi:MAG TPA: Si-specific NAD(P)(+) transhydrogenase [Polyangiaceae bacterium]|nr:Si-specific NAD(P)(+) transhydrogenase [Polyangiaceae bacterium]